MILLWKWMLINWTTKLISLIRKCRGRLEVRFNRFTRRSSSTAIWRLIGASGRWSNSNWVSVGNWTSNRVRCRWRRGSCCMVPHGSQVRWTLQEKAVYPGRPVESSVLWLRLGIETKRWLRKSLKCLILSSPSLIWEATTWISLLETSSSISRNPKIAIFSTRIDITRSATSTGIALSSATSKSNRTIPK